ncbi:MAG: hypothetical protein ACOX8I_07665 [Bacillota bacterium]
MNKIRFRDFELKPEERAQLFQKYAKESGPGGLRALDPGKRNIRVPAKLEVPPLDPNLVAKELGHPVVFRHAGSKYEADGENIKKSEG